MGVLTFVGTAKGAFVFRSKNRGAWAVEGPLFKGWKVTASTRTASGATLVATASDVYGPALHRSEDLVNWEQIENGPAWPQGDDQNGTRKLNQIWTLVQGRRRLYAGVDEAGVFFSEDGGDTWHPFAGLNEHETRPGWFPGAGGLCAHVILEDPKDDQNLWVGISAVGVFKSTDGGKTWQVKNKGVPTVIEDEVQKDIGACVHGLAADPDDANRIWRREHVGMFRSFDGGEQWERIENGLPYWFGFPVVIDPHTKDLFVIPLESDEYRMPSGGKFEVYRSQNGGNQWQSASHGLPQQNAYMGVLRGAMTVDRLDPCGLTFGTTAGTLFTSRDAGETWTQLPGTFPRIYSVETYHDD